MKARTQTPLHTHPCGFQDSSKDTEAERMELGGAPARRGTKQRKRLYPGRGVDGISFTVHPLGSLWAVGSHMCSTDSAQSESDSVIDPGSQMAKAESRWGSAPHTTATRGRRQPARGALLCCRR